MRRVAVHTLGCKLNFAETSTIAGQFREQGYEVVGIDDRADVCVINTCSVTDRADRECRQMVRRALRHSPNAYVIVTGCYAQLRPADIAGIPGVDLVLGTKEKFEIFQHADSCTKSECTRTFVSPIEDLSSFAPASSAGSADRTRAFIKVQDGCDYSCSFCTIPLARGASRSTPIHNVVLEARNAVQQGYKEIVLTGVNVGDYGSGTGSNLVDLLKALVLIKELARIRISSVEPNLLTDELISLWADNNKICKHFHVPLQGGNDHVLKGMRRRYLTSGYSDRIERIREALPEAGIGADVIAGFPGETEELFEESYKFLVDLPISYMHVFTYSERPDTSALSLEGKVEPKERFRRSEMLRILGARKRRAFYDSCIGSRKEVLFETQESDGGWSGLTNEYVRVKVFENSELSNQIGTALITGIQGEMCTGDLIDTSPNNSVIYPATLNEVSVCG